tara:strand:- start:211 stop:369 length:159 start_codon:yes stop_codon:yes gene_type:complete
MNRALERLEYKHKVLKKLVEDATGDLVQKLKKEKLFVKDQLVKARQQAKEVL